MTLLKFNQSVDNVFSLFGTDENSATFALGWVLEYCPKFCARFIENIIGSPIPLENLVIRLQSHGDDRSCTDIEIEIESHLHIIVEAKKLWELPTMAQLERYALRVVSEAENKFIVSLSAASPEYAQSYLRDNVQGVPLVHRSWLNVQSLVRDALRESGSHEQKLWLRQLEKHLRGYVSMQDPKDNTVFVVSLSSDKLGPDYSYIDVVEKDGKYFHRVGHHWPFIPPNYIGFRYHGKLQSVHHIESYQVIENLADINPYWPQTDCDQFVYTLGPPMRPVTEVRTGNIFRNNRVRCAIDTLLSGAFDTVSAAKDETDRRLQNREV